jgi:hypothetical protein
MALLDWGVLAILAITVVGWLIVDYRERRLARASSLHDQKIRLFQDLDVIVGNLTTAVSALESTRTIDTQKKDEIGTSHVKLLSIPFVLGSRDSVYTILDFVSEHDEPKTDKQTKDYVEELRNAVLLECLIRTTELQNTLLEALSRLEFVEYGTNVKTSIEGLLNILSELSSQSGAAMWYEGIGLKGLVQPPKLEEWTPRAGKAIDGLKEAMKKDLSKSI